MTNNQSVAAATMSANSVDWDSLSPAQQQAIITAVNQGIFGPWFTNLLATEAWNKCRFVVCEHFKVKVNGGVCSGFGDNFQNWFFHLSEDLKAPRALQSFPLEKATYDKDIVKQIGGVAKAVASLQDICVKMKAQTEGPKEGQGFLGNWNIIYVPQPVTKIDDHTFTYLKKDGTTSDPEGVENSDYLFEIDGVWYVLRAVGVCWNVGGWCVSAHSVEDGRSWVDGRLVFSRKDLKS